MKIAKLNINDTQMRSDLKITEIPIKGFGKLISLKGDKFTQKDIYDFIGKNDYNVSLFFYNQSISDIKFGAVLSGRFLFTRQEREYLINKTLLRDLATYQPFLAEDNNISIEVLKDLKENGIHLNDICEIQYFPIKINESYHDKNTNKEIPKIFIKAPSWDKQKTINIERNFLVQRFNSKESLIPEEKAKFVGYLLAERNGVIDSRILNMLNMTVHEAEQNIRVTYYLYKYKATKNPNDEEVVKRYQYYSNSLEIEKIKIALNEIVKLRISETETNKIIAFIQQIKKFIPAIIKYTGGVPIWWDEKSFAHFCLRHTKEYQLNHYRYKVKYPKTPYSYKFNDIQDLMEKVFDFYEDDISFNFSQKIPKPFYKNETKAVLYKGDYYSFQIEKDGRVSQFFQYQKE